MKEIRGNGAINFFGLRYGMKFHEIAHTPLFENKVAVFALHGAVDFAANKVRVNGSRNS